MRTKANDQVLELVACQKKRNIVIPANQLLVNRSTFCKRTENELVLTCFYCSLLLIHVRYVADHDMTSIKIRKCFKQMLLWMVFEELCGSSIM